jgi:hypothetical protein
MLEVILITWLAAAFLTAWGFHLVRRHWQHTPPPKSPNHPVYGNRATFYDWDDET